MVALEATSDDLTAWHVAQARLPSGWTLDGLRSGLTGLEPGQHSDDRVAGATDPRGEERRHRATDSTPALDGLATRLGAPDRQ